MSTKKKNKKTDNSSTILKVIGVLVALGLIAQYPIIGVLAFVGLAIVFWVKTSPPSTKEESTNNRNSPIISKRTSSKQQPYPKHQPIYISTSRVLQIDYSTYVDKNATELYQRVREPKEHLKATAEKLHAKNNKLLDKWERLENKLNSFQPKESVADGKPPHIFSIIVQRKTPRIQDEINACHDQINANFGELDIIDEALSENQYCISETNLVSCRILRRTLRQLRDSRLFIPMGHSIDLDEERISSEQRQRDLKGVSYPEEPIAVIIEKYRCYFFPGEILVFEGADELVAILKPASLQATLNAKEIKCTTMNESFYDTKYNHKSIPHHYWQHQNKDGSPDLRYNYNPRLVSYSDELYWLDCFLTISFCGFNMEYHVSSYDNCKAFEQAVAVYNGTQSRFQYNS